tara:strand:- start:100 stop:330 length:231 start_codon:yes stop_codon:yes gene_type:complete
MEKFSRYFARVYFHRRRKKSSQNLFPLFLSGHLVKIILAALQWAAICAEHPHLLLTLLMMMQRTTAATTILVLTRF